MRQASDWCTSDTTLAGVLLAAQTAPARADGDRQYLHQNAAAIDHDHVANFLAGLLTGMLYCRNADR